jgi:hypothetical protein
VDDHGNHLTFKLYPPLRNAIEGNILAKRGNVLEYRANLEALSKPKHSCYKDYSTSATKKEKGEVPMMM